MLLKRWFWRMALGGCFAILGAGCNNASENAAPKAPLKLKTHTNSIEMDFVLIPAGRFTMGADKNLEEASNDETPPHPVTITQPFYLGKYEVTQAQWMAVMKKNPTQHQAQDNPVAQVSWGDVQVFISRLNAKEGHKRYRLPTEAEWEYAARAGTTTKFSFGDDAKQLGQYAWFGEDWETGSTHPVGQKAPNAWGLYDMHGNVWEWVQDWYKRDYYQHSPTIDPKGPASGLYRLLRGGSWRNSAAYCRVADRGSYSPGVRLDGLGFRLALSVEIPVKTSDGKDPRGGKSSPDSIKEATREAIKETIGEE